MKDGGLAFPRTGGTVEGPNTSEWVTPQGGMTMRQWYKGMVLQGLLAPSRYQEVDGIGLLDSSEKFVAAAAMYADEMLKEDEAFRARGK